MILYSLFSFFLYFSLSLYVLLQDRMTKSLLGVMERLPPPTVGCGTYQNFS